LTQYSEKEPTSIKEGMNSHPKSGTIQCRQTHSFHLPSPIASQHKNQQWLTYKQIRTETISNMSNGKVHGSSDFTSLKDETKYPHDSTQKVATNDGFLLEMKIPSPVPSCKTIINACTLVHQNLTNCRDISLMAR
jgi:hypothetical protein